MHRPMLLIPVHEGWTLPSPAQPHLGLEGSAISGGTLTHPYPQRDVKRAGFFLLTVQMCKQGQGPPCVLFTQREPESGYIVSLACFLSPLIALLLLYQNSNWESVSRLK